MKRRRTRQEILEEKEEARKKEELIQGKLAEFEQLKAKADDYDRIAKELEGATEMRETLLSTGHLISENGILSPCKLPMSGTHE